MKRSLGRRTQGPDRRRPHRLRPLRLNSTTAGGLEVVDQHLVGQLADNKAVLKCMPQSLARHGTPLTSRQGRACGETRQHSHNDSTHPVGYAGYCLRDRELATIRSETAATRDEHNAA